MTGDSALAAIRADMDRMRHTFDMDKNNLGRDLCKAFTDGVQDNLANEHSAEGEGWEYLSPAYEEWKEFNYPGQQISYLHGLMDNPREIAGEMTTLTPETAIVTEGISEAAREEYSWFSEGNAHQPARPSWGFTPDSRKEISDILDKRFQAK
jgi:phage gpG-like protein